MTEEESKQLRDFAFTIANSAIHDFRIGVLKSDSDTYKEIQAKIDWYNKVTYREIK